MPDKYGSLLENIEDEYKNVFKKIILNSGYVTEELEKFLEEQTLNEAPTVAQDVPFDAKIMLPLINSAFAGSVAKNLVNIQPISVPRQVVFSPVIKDNLDKIIVGGGKVDWFPPSPYVGVEKEDLTGEALVSFENIFVNKDSTNFYNRKIKISLTNEMMQDIKNLFGIDYYNENIKAAANTLSMILDYDILNTIITKVDYSGKTYNYVWDATKTKNVRDSSFEIVSLIDKASGDMARETRKGLADWMIIPPIMLGIFSRLSYFEPIKQISRGILFVAGKINNMLVLVNTLASDEERSIYIGKNVPGDNNGGIIYAPYKTEMTNEAYDPNNFNFNRAIMSRYGVVVPKNGSYFYRKINILVSEQSKPHFPYYNYEGVSPVPSSVATSVAVKIPASAFLSTVEYSPSGEITFNLKKDETSSCDFPGVYTTPTDIKIKVYNYTEESGNIVVAPVVNDADGTPQAESIAAATGGVPSATDITISITTSDNNTLGLKRLGADGSDTLDADVYFEIAEIDF